MSKAIKVKRILILTATTGGGHLSVAKAVAEALSGHYAKRVEVKIVDALKTYAPPPFYYSAEIYNFLTRQLPSLWFVMYRLSELPITSAIFKTMANWYSRGAYNRLLQEQPADLIISTHFFTGVPLAKHLAKMGTNTELVCLVTDLITMTPMWFDSSLQYCWTPTQTAARLATDHGVKPEAIKVTGLPIDPSLARPRPSKFAARKQLNWPSQLPVILVLSGVNGLRTVQELAGHLQHLDATIVIVTGRDRKLFNQLERLNLPPHIQIYGFVENLPQFMQAADILITKAGPSTICEAMAAGLPLILYNRIAGPETGNVEFVISGGSGIWENDPKAITAICHTWLTHPAVLDKMSRAAITAAQPNAATRVASEIGKLIGLA